MQAGVPANRRGEESRVTVNFRDNGATTEVILNHEKLCKEEGRRGTETGWNSCFDALAQLLKDRP